MAGRTNLFFVANSHAALRLRVCGHIADNDHAVVVHSLEIPTTLPRSPRSAPGRTGMQALREVSIKELMEGSANASGLLERFREETAL
jgi:hypothetical protein